MLTAYLRYRKLIYCMALLITFILCTLIIKHYFRPFSIIILILFLCSPIHSKLCKINLFTSRANALISIILVNCLFFITAIFIGNFIYKGINYFINNFTDLTLNIENILENISKVTNINLTELNNSLLNGYRNVMNSDFLKKGAVYTTDGLFAYFIGNVAAYFILSDKYAIVNHVKNFMPKDKAHLVKDKLDDINKMLRVELALIIFTTAETIIGFMILNIKNFIPLGILCGFLDILPYVGTIMVFLPLIFYKILAKEYIIVIGLIALYILLMINRQVMETKFMSDRLAVHPLFIILSIYISVKAFGTIGLFMGPIYVIIAKEIVNN